MSARPPRVEGLEEPHGWDFVRMGLWAGRGILRTLVRARGLHRAWHAIALVGWAMCAATITTVPLLQWAHCHRPGARHYMSPGRDAVLGITARAGRWRIDNHLAANPGTGQGAALRARLIPALTAHGR